MKAAFPPLPLYFCHMPGAASRPHGFAFAAPLRYPNEEWLLSFCSVIYFFYAAASFCFSSAAYLFFSTADTFRSFFALRPRFEVVGYDSVPNGFALPTGLYTSRLRNFFGDVFFVI